MPKQPALLVDWFGPYNNEDELHDVLSTDYETGLYLALGRKPRERRTKIQYVGISKNLFSRLNTSAKLKQITSHRQIWLGEVATFGRVGAATKRNLTRVDLAEWAIAYFMEPCLNEQKTVNPPPQPITLINRWWKKDYETRRIQRPHKDWPDIIDYCGEDYDNDCRLGWVKKANFF